MKENLFSKSEGFKSEYSCAVVRVGNLQPVEGSDFLAKTLVFGTQIVVRNDQVKEGDIMLYAANETQLCHEFLSANNLYEISCRENNANAAEVDAIMSEYEPVRVKADKLRAQARSIKSSIDSFNKKAKKYEKDADKLEAKIAKMVEGSEEFEKASIQLKEKRQMADEALSKAMSKLSRYTELKNEVETLVNSGKHIVDEAKKHCGFFNKYGRVRCITLKNTPSFGFLFSPTELIKYDDSITVEDVLEYVGNEFDTVNGKLFVKAYVPPMPKETVRREKTNRAQKKVAQFDRIVDGEFFFHYDTEQLQKSIFLFKPDDVVDISVKLHGTSVIIGKLRVREPLKLPLVKRIFNKFVDITRLLKSLRVPEYMEVYGPVYSSRKVIKNRYINEGVGDGYYKSDIYSEWGDIIYPYLDEGVTVYGEIIGYVTGTDRPIQKTYDYGCKPGESKLMVYRVTLCDKTELDVDDVLDWTYELIERMKEAGDANYNRIHPINLVYQGTLGDLYPNIDTNSHWHENVLDALKNDKLRFGMEADEPLCTEHKVPREGICVRKHGDKVRECFKLKTVAFALGEAIRMDEGDVDMEMAVGYGEEGDGDEN